MAVVVRRSWPRIFWTAARDIPFCSARVAQVWRSHVGDDIPGDLGAVGNPLDDLLGLPRADEPPVIQGEIGFQECAEPCRERDDALFAPRAVGASLARDAEGALLPLDVVEGQGTEFRDPEPGVEQRPDDQFLFEASARIGEPIGLLGAEGLVDELVGQLLTRSGTSAGSLLVGDAEPGFASSWRKVAGGVRAWREQDVPPGFRLVLAGKGEDVEAALSSRFYGEGELSLAGHVKIS